MIDKIETITQQLPVMEAFYTIQGEGFFQGRAAYFIRLGGCDVGCIWCDVKESWNSGAHPVKKNQEIVQAAVRESGLNTSSNKGNIIAVVTGGEPLMHDLDDLTRELKTAGFHTNIETSGSSPLTGDWDWICLSPKKFKPPLPGILEKADELKVVIFNRSDFDWAEQFAAKVSPACKLYLQPEWSKAAQVTPLMIDYIKTNPKWELSLQIHKYISVP
ncbi:MAG: 7-carboxy-7-deazaguanine synthase QueE [Chitinophagaceae bacterium]